MEKEKQIFQVRSAGGGHGTHIVEQKYGQKKFEHEFVHRAGGFRAQPVHFSQDPSQHQQDQHREHDITGDSQFRHRSDPFPREDRTGSGSYLLFPVSDPPYCLYHNIFSLSCPYQHTGRQLPQLKQKSFVFFIR